MTRYCYDHPRPAVTVDAAVFQWREQALKILLVRRAREPFAGQWALPGGFVNIEEPLEQAAQRELREETGLDGVELTPFRTFGRPGRDPRGRTISIVCICVLPPGHQAQVQGGDDAGQAAWFDVRSLPALAFDHGRIVRSARRHLRRQALHHGLAFDLLEETFPAAHLLDVYEALLGRQVNAEALLRRLTSLDLLEAVGGQAQATYRLRRDRLALFLREERLAPFGDATSP